MAPFATTRTRLKCVSSGGKYDNYCGAYNGVVKVDIISVSFQSLRHCTDAASAIISSRTLNTKRKINEDRVRL